MLARSLDTQTARFSQNEQTDVHEEDGGDRFSRAGAIAVVLVEEVEGNSVLGLNTPVTGASGPGSRGRTARSARRRAIARRCSSDPYRQHLAQPAEENSFAQ